MITSPNYMVTTHDGRLTDAAVKWIRRRLQTALQDRHALLAQKRTFYDEIRAVEVLEEDVNETVTRLRARLDAAGVPYEEPEAREPEAGESDAQEPEPHRSEPARELPLEAAARGAVAERSHPYPNDGSFVSNDGTVDGADPSLCPVCKQPMTWRPDGSGPIHDTPLGTIVAGEHCEFTAWVPDGAQSGPGK